MLVLTSSGLSSAQLLDETKKHLAPGARTAALVTTASVGRKERERNVPHLVDELARLGLATEFFDIEFRDPRLLLEYDVVEINGGNPFYLLNQIRRSGAAEILREIGEEKILIGISAGSLVQQRNLELIFRYIPKMNARVRLTDFTALALTDIETFPHYKRFVSTYDRFEARAQEYERENNCSVVRLNDGDGVFVSGGSSRVVRGEPERIDDA